MFVAHNGRQYRCYVTSTGREKHWLGCTHAKPREAVAHSVPAYVSPLRTDSPVSSSYPSDGDVPGGGLTEAPAADPSHAMAGASLGR